MNITLYHTIIIKRTQCEYPKIVFKTVPEEEEEEEREEKIFVTYFLSILFLRYNILYY